MTDAAYRPVITGLDLPADAPGGSVELLYDLYCGPAAPLPAQVFMLPPSGGPVPGRDWRGLVLLDVPGKSVDGAAFGEYARGLAAAVAARLVRGPGAVLHLQHLAFGASPALLAAFGQLPALALVHGTDLLLAEAHATQARVLREVASAAARVVVPTVAMADRLRQLVPGLDIQRVEHVPWGIPAALLDRPSAPRTAAPGAELRLLYAGRLTTEKGGRQLVEACANLPGVRLSIAAPADQYAALGAVVDLSPVRWLGWLPRTRLWEAFAAHDLLVVPSTVLEAFGLVAVEAQACGLPVLHQPVPGLREVLAGSALPVDLADPAALAAELDWLRTDPSALADLRTAGLANAARYPLAATAAGLASLGEQIS